MAPKGETAEAQGEAGPERLGHGGEGACAVAAPVHRVFLPADCRAAGEHAGLPDSALLLKQLEDRLIIEKRVVVVHQHGITAVKVNAVCGNALAEIGFE